jgi:hypothetical protein
VEARIIAGVAKFPRGTVRTFPRDMDPCREMPQQEYFASKLEIQQ